MKTNKTVSYALACLKELARHWGDPSAMGGGFVQVAEIARNQAVPVAYCQKILLALARAGIVESVKGRGFMLLRPMENITTLDVVNALSVNEPASFPSPLTGEKGAVPAKAGSVGEGDSTLRLINEMLVSRLNKALAELSVAEIVKA